VITTLISVENTLQRSFTEIPAIKLDLLVSTMNCTNTKSWHLILKNLSRILLYQSLTPGTLVELLPKLSQYNVSTLITDLEYELPKEVVRDDDTMDWLEMCTRRINDMQVPRYAKLKEVLSGFMERFIWKDEEKVEYLSSGDMVSSTMSTKHTINEMQIKSNATLLQNRYQRLQRHVNDLPWNVSKRQQLEKLGYRQEFWWKPMDSIEVETDGMLNLDENLRQSLLSCYGEYVEILNRLDIPSITVDGEKVKTGDIFTDELELPYLKGRRSIVLKVNEFFIIIFG